MQAALDDWDRASVDLERLYVQLNDDLGLGQRLDVKKLAAPLPRAYEWVDGSAFINHIILVRKARGAEISENIRPIRSCIKVDLAHLFQRW